ncbi:branched-chain amino acid ABC transporter substrate-binding protein [Tistrella bauzanensis]|uniref:Branched-chain amino acid ABC transporter substrate-binding protein n=1 Tax=Tistrella bauzanensis TaxID=657419 RepID=A0ABQ1ICY0_9PROT|nr:ABC transporter substrate-binding protein [Tistrella bauzanensis]GGB33997.1 branched-chain amino acid ABC transporter substrate-binding protein [Tistrella bauzanensis]
MKAMIDKRRTRRETLLAGARSVAGALALVAALSGLSTAVTPAMAADTAVIGYSGPLSGGAALYGRNVQRGMQMAIDDVNKAGGMDIKGEKVMLELASLDDRYLPNETAVNAQRLVYQNGARIVFIPHSGGILAAQGFNTRGPQSFIIGAYTSEPAILNQKNPLQMMIPPRYNALFEPYAKAAMERSGKRLGMIPGTHAYAKEWTKGFSAKWKELGGEVLTDNAVDYRTTTDFSSAVAKALSEKPDVLFIGGPSQPTALIVQAAREQGFKGGFVIMDQAKPEEMDNIVPIEMMNGLVGNLPLEYYPSKNAPAFIKKYQDTFGANEEAVAEIGLPYTAIMVFVRAMELAGTTEDPQAIMARLAEASATLPPERNPYELTGVDDDNNMASSFQMTVVENGKYVPLPFK